MLLADYDEGDAVEDMLLVDVHHIAASSFGLQSETDVGVE